MKATKTYSLAFSGMALLTFSAQLIFLSPRLQVAALPFQNSRLFLDLAGVAFYLLGVILTAAVLLDYSETTQTNIKFIAAIMLIIGGWTYLRIGIFVEVVVFFALALGFVLSTLLTIKRDWLVEIMQWANLLIGLGLLIYPRILLQAQEYILLAKVSNSVAVIFIVSSLASMAIGIFPAFYKGKAGRFLSLPWFIWVLMFIAPFSILNLGVAISVGLGLALNEFVPWQKIVMHQAVDIGRRFYRLVVISQIISLGVIVWLVRFTETNLSMPPASSTLVHDVMIVSYNVMAALGILTVTWINLSVNGTFSGLTGTRSETRPIPSRAGSVWKRFTNSLFEPFETSQNYISEVVDARKEYEALLSRQLAAEKRRVSQLSLLHELNLNLEIVLDPPVAAQLTTNAIHNFLGGSITTVLRYDDDREEMVVLAASGPNSGNIPPGYRQPISVGIIGRAARLRRTQLASDVRLDHDYIHMDGHNPLSEVVVPLLHNNRLRGVVVIDHPEPNFFDESDIRTLETAAIQLITSWIRSEHDQRLTNLIGAGVALSTTLDVEGLIQEIAETAQKTLDAHFAFVALVDQDGKFTRTAHIGYAPILLGILSTDPGGNELVQNVLNSPTAFRLRDVRKRFSSTPTGSNDLRSLLAVPIRLRQSSIGTILAFGKKGNSTFSENDEALISLLATQSAAAIETTWLYQESRRMLATATQLYQLSTRVIQAEQISDAARAIGETAYQLSKGEAAGIVLLSPEGEVEVKMQVDKNGPHPGAHHPIELIDQALENGQTIILSGKKNSTRMCMPLQTPRRQYGALWVDVEEDQYNSTRFTDTMQSLVNQAAIALERSLLLVETRKQAEQIEAAYHELELTYDQTLGALSSALDARDRETEGHSLRVARLACALGKRLGFSAEQAKIMERGAILHDIGKIGISDTILLKPGPLTTSEWEMMRLHPDIGARIIEGIPFLKDALPVIRYHQERWNGSGYPIGLKAHDIPLMARIFAVVDAFDALTSERPYRKPIPTEDAVAYLREQANIHFDPVIVDEFAKMANEGIIDTLK